MKVAFILFTKEETLVPIVRSYQTLTSQTVIGYFYLLVTVN